MDRGVKLRRCFTSHIVVYAAVWLKAAAGLSKIQSTARCAKCRIKIHDLGASILETSVLMTNSDLLALCHTFPLRECLGEWLPE